MKGEYHSADGRLLGCCFCSFWLYANVPSSLKMVAVSSCDTSVYNFHLNPKDGFSEILVHSQNTTRRNNPQDRLLHSQRSDKLSCYINTEVAVKEIRWVGEDCTELGPAAGPCEHGNELSGSTIRLPKRL
jgi:hypothetical protein